MALNDKELEDLQDLAALRLDDDEKPRLLAKLERILSYVDQLQDVDTSRVDPHRHLAQGSGELREDRPRPCLSPEQALHEAPEVESDHFEIPPVMGERQDS